MPTPAMEAVLAEEWGAYGVAVLDETGRPVCVLNIARGNVLETDEAMFRTLLMANALRMVRLLREWAREASVNRDYCPMCLMIDHSEDCPFTSTIALLRDLGLES